jgi:cytochrome c biogenesis protein CcmG, thiol:disulfide interchange protein DsbE
MRARLLPALLLVLACEGKPPAPAPTAAEVRDPAPAFRGITLEGEPFDLAELRGRVVLLNVWATWCEPCKQEMPELQALHVRHRDQGLTLVGVSVDAARLAGEVRRLVAEFGLTYTNVHDARNTAGSIFKIRGYPTSLLIGRDGGMLWRKDGLIEPGDPELARALADALAAP